jgi:ABC-type glycerol-3-phosphate transport system substrate-binding protein
MSVKRPSRRDFLKAAAGTVGAGAVAGAGAGLLNAGRAEAAPRTVRTARLSSGGVLWGLQYDPHVAAYHRLVDLFKKQTGATLQVAPQAWPLDTKLIAAAAAGTQPDVACVLGCVCIDLFMQKVVTPVENSVFKAQHIDINRDFIGDSVQAFSWGGHIWGVPVESNADGGVVNVPVDAVEAAGLQSKYPPTNGQTFFNNYDDLYALGQALQVKRLGRVHRWGLSSQGWEDVSMFSIMRSLGVNWWDSQAKKYNIDSEAGIMAMQWLVEKPVKLGIEGEITGSTQVDLALAGKIALAQGNPTIATSDTAKLGYHYELSGVPRVKAGQDPLFVGQGGWGFSGLSKAKHPDVALAFQRMIATKEAQLEYAKIYGGLMFFAWRDLIGDKARFADPSPSSPNVKAATVMARLLPRTVYYGEGYGYYSPVSTAVGNAAQGVREGKLTSAAAVKQIQTQCEAQYQQYLKDLQKM